MHKRVTIIASGCVSVKSHLTSGVSVRPENTEAGNGGQKFMGVSLKLPHCKDLALPLLKAICTVGHFPANSIHVHYSIYTKDCALKCIP